MKILDLFFTFKSKAAYVLDLHLAIPYRREKMKTVTEEKN